MYKKLIKIFLLCCLLELAYCETEGSTANVTPYPTAEELKPEQPFEEGTTPDTVYGPPDVDVVLTDAANDSETEVAIAVAFDGAQPDTDIIETESLNPETTIDSDAEEALGEDTLMVKPEAERLIFNRRFLARPAKLRAPATQTSSASAEAPTQGFFYIAQLQQF